MSNSQKKPVKKVKIFVGEKNLTLSLCPKMVNKN